MYDDDRRSWSLFCRVSMLLLFQVSAVCALAHRTPKRTVSALGSLYFCCLRLTLSVELLIPFALLLSIVVSIIRAFAIFAHVHGHTVGNFHPTLQAFPSYNRLWYKTIRSFSRQECSPMSAPRSFREWRSGCAARSLRSYETRS